MAVGSYVTAGDRTNAREQIGSVLQQLEARLKESQMELESVHLRARQLEAERDVLNAACRGLHNALDETVKAEPAYVNDGPQMATYR